MGDTARPRKHPYGRMATLRWGFWDVATGLVTLLTLGEVTPRWALDSSFKAAYKAARRKKETARG